MKKVLVFTILVAWQLALALPATAATIWSEDFEGATLGDTSGNNATLAGTDIQTANTASSIVVDATTDPAAAAAFTLASGNFIRLSVEDNGFAAVRITGGQNAITAVSDTDILTMSVDIYIPGSVDLAAPVYGFNPRLESSGASGNGDTFTDQAVAAPGQYTITYTGTVADFKNPMSTGDADSIRPFLFIAQNVAATDFLYMDNIFLDISPVPEPGSLALALFGCCALMVRRSAS